MWHRSSCPADTGTKRRKEKAESLTSRNSEVRRVARRLEWTRSARRTLNLAASAGLRAGSRTGSLGRAGAGRLRSSGDRGSRL